MQIGVSLSLAVFLLLGQIHPVKLTINKFSQTNLSKWVGVLLSLGVTDDLSPTEQIISKRSEYACIYNKSRVRISFEVSEDTELAKEFQVGINSGNFIGYETYNDKHEWLENVNLCFLFGTFWPSGTKASKKVSVYLNIITSRHSILDREVFYYRASIRGNSVDSSLYVTKYRKATDDLGVSLENFKKIIEDLDEAKEKVKKTRDLIALFDNSEKTLVGFINCWQDRMFGISFYLDSSTFTLCEDGDFTMAFLTTKLELSDEEALAANFARMGVTNSVDNRLASLRCDLCVINLKSKFDFPNKKKFVV